MSKIALCWELGGGLGHINHLGPLAHFFVSQGHEVIFVLKKGENNHKELFPANTKIYETPDIFQFRNKKSISRSYIELLYNIGYANEEWLEYSLNTWRSIFIEEKCDIIVTDHSPTARLAAHSLKIKHVGIGSGFFVPTNFDYIPDWNFFKPNENKENINKLIIENINFVFQKYNISPIVTTQNVITKDYDIVCTLPELDHYNRKKEEKYWGLLPRSIKGENFKWKETSKHKIFCYLKKDTPNIKVFAKALNEIKADKTIYLENGDTDNLFNSETLILDKPASIDSVIEKATLVVSHGGHNLTAQMLMNGIPSFLMPMHVEQFMYVSKLHKLGLCEMSLLNNNKENIIFLINKALKNKKLKNNAMKFSNYYTKLGVNIDIEKMAKVILSI